MTIHEIITTPLASFRATWTATGLYSFEFAPAGVVQVERSDGVRTEEVSDCQFAELRKSLAVYFESGDLEWDLQSLDWKNCTSFQRDILIACYQIPKGETWTYGQLAEQVGSPKAARAVGGVMARNRWPLIIPCHRVVGSNGKLVGYSGEGGLDTKRRLLDFEAQFASQARFEELVELKALWDGSGKSTP